MIKRFWIVLLIALLAVSCSQQRLIYMQEPLGAAKEDIYPSKDMKYALQPLDILSVRIKTMNPEVDELFNSSSFGQGANQSQNLLQGGGSQFYFSGYTVNDSGYIALPVLGFVKVGGLTMPQVDNKLQVLANELIEDALVIAKLVSFRVTFMGEVGAVGVQVFMQDELNIFEALAKVGGISNYGNRKEVLIVRKNNKQRETLVVDLTQRMVLSDERFYLQPNDIVYVEPIKRKVFKMDTQDVLFYLTSISSILTTTLLVFSLTK